MNHRPVNESVQRWIERAGWVEVGALSATTYGVSSRETGIRVDRDGEILTVFDTEFGATRGALFHTNCAEAVERYVLYQVGYRAQEAEGRTQTSSFRRNDVAFLQSASLEEEEPDRLILRWGRDCWASFCRSDFPDVWRLAHLLSHSQDEIERAFESEDGGALFMSSAEQRRRRTGQDAPTGESPMPWGDRNPLTWEEYLAWREITKGEAHQGEPDGAEEPRGDNV